MYNSLIGNIPTAHEQRRISQLEVGDIPHVIAREHLFYLGFHRRPVLRSELADRFVMVAECTAHFRSIVFPGGSGNKFLSTVSIDVVYIERSIAFKHDSQDFHHIQSGIPERTDRNIYPDPLTLYHCRPAISFGRFGIRKLITVRKLYRKIPAAAFQIHIHVYRQRAFDIPRTDTGISLAQLRKFYNLIFRTSQRYDFRNTAIV